MNFPRWIREAYKGTDVHWSRSQGAIHKMLNELDIFEVRFTNMRDKFALEFLVKIAEDQKPRVVRIVTPLHYQGNDEAKRTKELNIVHRILAVHIKAKFVAIGRGLTEFEQEFMAHLVITDKAGNSRTMGDALLPEYRKSIDSGDNPDFKLLGDGQ